MKKTYQHTIDVLFPIAIFFVFSSTALLILLLAANIYRSAISCSNTTFAQTTALSYISEKIRQYDSGGSNQIYLDEFDGCEALAISQTYGTVSYTTYIYALDGDMKEIILVDGVIASAQSGTTILHLKSLDMFQLAEGLFQFTCTAEDGSNDSIIIHLRSENY